MHRRAPAAVLVACLAAATPPARAEDFWTKLKKETEKVLTQPPANQKQAPAKPGTAAAPAKPATPGQAAPAAPGTIPPAPDVKFTEEETLAKGADVVGLKLGMSPAEAKAVLAERKEAVTETRKRINVTFAPGRTAVAPDDVQFSTLATNPYHLTLRFTPGPRDERLAFVGRVVNFPPDSTLYDTVLETVLEKYGPPTIRQELAVGGVVLQWLYGEHTARQRSGSATGPQPHGEFCPAGRDPLSGSSGKFWTAGPPELDYIDTALRHCGGSSLQVTVWRRRDSKGPEGSPYAGQMSVYLASLAMDSAVIRRLLESAAGVAEQEEQAKLEKAKSAAKKPDL